MVNIEIQFTAGRWHATPWGRQVNEGVTEWPPSSWRIMRALVAAWHDKLPDVPRSEMAELVERLSEPPVFQLPNAVPAHLRHYMKLGDGKPTKILDGFLAVCRDEPLRIVWPDVELSERQASLLARLVEVLSYFGRAESWVEARVAENWNGEFNSAPTMSDPASKQGDEVVRVLAPAALEEFDRWREETRESMRRRALEAAAKKKPGQAAPKLGKKQLAEIDAAVPNDLLAALETSTEDLRGGGWNRPPGSRWIDYRRNTDLAPHVARRSRIVRTTSRPTVARFAVSGVVRPMLTEAVAVGELFRSAAMYCSGRLAGNARSVFSGRDDEGRRSDDAHRHAHFFSEA
ncbi:MAG TPA: type I-U CRISPR-associated protein Csb2, partial [Pirellulaceae bacterium]|nr:type I-U CRISPR-associated protein Csb2 [Pirellulaceae bacterium]